MRKNFFKYTTTKVMSAVCAAAALLTFAAGNGTISDSFIINAEAAESVFWNSVTLDSDGYAAWDASFSSSEAVDTYEIRLSRQKDGNWTDNYKTYKTSDKSYNISFTSKGKYYIKVRIKFIGGAYSDWSPASASVNVTSDDIDRDSPDSGNTYINYYGYNGYPMGPGSDSNYNYYGPKGPGEGGASSYSNTSVINTVTGAYVNGNANTVSSQNQNFNGANTPSGWIKTGTGYMYRYGNGTYAKNGWERVDGSWYYFNANGIMKTGWLHVDNRWYYALPSGKIAVSGWNNINEKWYYFNESGIMQTGYITVDGKTYYTDSSGARVQSAYNPDGHLFDLNGEMIK